MIIYLGGLLPAPTSGLPGSYKPGQLFPAYPAGLQCSQAGSRGAPLLGLAPSGV